VIEVKLSIDIDNTSLQTTYKRRIQVSSPPGYETKVWCADWGRTLETGAVHMDIGLSITSPPDLLPRILIDGGGS
jgi:hypothetical protein